MTRKLEILLVSPPLSEPIVPNLAIELLAWLAKDRGHNVDTLHGGLLQPPGLRDDLIHGLAAQAIFAPFYYGIGPPEFVEELIVALYHDFQERDGLSEQLREPLTEEFLFATGEAERCVGRFLDVIPARRYDLIGFSVGFDSQKLPAAAIAKALRARGERALILAGGTGTDEAMGPAFLEQFPEFDVVVQGEAEEAWPRLLERLESQETLDDVPGCVLRRDGRIVTVPEAPPGRGFLRLPPPDYSAFLAQRERSAYSDESFYLLAETSRGCWWGRRRHCTFCGIRSVDQEYRVRPPDEAVALLTAIYDRYKPEVIYCTDPIAPATYVNDVWPKLAHARRERPDWKIFYELKSNARRHHIARMAAAGVQRVQPGIESLSSPALRLMNKGASALQQVCFLKWARAYRLTVFYGLIAGMPGETSDQLAAMVSMIRRIYHLPPPIDVNQLALHRFSPHFADPARYGLHDVRPFATQRTIYRCPDERIRRLCYQLDFTVPDQTTSEYVQAREGLVTAVTEWQKRYDAGAGLWMRHTGDARFIVQASSEDRFSVDVVTDPVEVLVLDECAAVTSLPRVAHLSGTPLHTVDAAARKLAARGLLLLEEQAALSLPVPSDVDAHADARLDDVGVDDLRSESDKVILQPPDSHLHQRIVQ